MLISTETTMGLQCQSCGKIRFDRVGLFHLFFPEGNRGKCSCGADLYIVKPQKKDSIELIYGCIYCGKSHRLIMQRREIRQQSLRVLTCSEKKLAVGYLGEGIQVEKACQIMKKKFVQILLLMIRDDEKELDFDYFFDIYDHLEKFENFLDKKQKESEERRDHIVVL